MSSSTSLFNNRDYKLLLAGQIVSDFGTWISHIAYPLLFLNLTGSPLQAGLSLALSQLPTFLFGLLAGTIIDSFDRKKLMIICDLVRFLILGSIPLALYLDALTLTHLYLAAFLSGTCDVFFATTVQSALTRVVSKEETTRAFGQYEAVVNTASLIGPAIGGALYQIRSSLPFIVDAISYAFSAFSLLFIRSEFQEERRQPTLRFAEITKGAHWLWQRPVIRSITTIRTIGAIVSGGQTLLIILLAKQFTNDTTAVGIIISVGSIGVVLGTSISDRIEKRFGSLKAMIISRWIIAASLPLQLLSPNLILLTITVGLSYLSVAVYGTIATSYRLKRAPDELQGRVNSFHRMLVFGGLAIGGLLTGYLAEQTTLITTYVLYTLILGILAINLAQKLGRKNDND